MTTFKQAATPGLLKNMSDDDLKQVLQMGITGVEMVPSEQYGRYRDLGFTIATIGGHKSLQDGLNKRENHNRIADELRANLEVAKKFEIPNLICFSGNRNGLSDEAGLEICAEGLLMVAKDAEEAGVTLIPELLNSKVNHPDYQCDHTSWGVQLCEAVNSPRVKLLYDIYHMQIMEGDLIRTIQEHHQHIAHYHTAGNPGRKDLDSQQEIFYPPIMRAIQETGYTGWVGHEFGAKTDAMSALKQAFEVCNV